MKPKEQYTFGDFIVDRSNAFAFMAARTAAEKPGKVFNPIYIYGEEGCGKTHLLDAIFSSVRESAPNAKVCFCSANEMVSEMISAIKTDQLKIWREKTLMADLVLIDDMQLLVNKQATQHEMISLIRACVKKNIQVVLTSSVPPENLPVLYTCFREELENGLFADIQSKDTEKCTLT